MKLTNSLKQIFLETAAELISVARRFLMASMVKQLDYGSPSHAAQEQCFRCGTLRNGLPELDGGVTGIDNYIERGRQPCETHLPAWLEALKAIVESPKSNRPSVHPFVCQAQCTLN